MVVRDAHGGEFCRRWYATQVAAEIGRTELHRTLVDGAGDVLGALERWFGDRIQLPFGFADWLDRWRNRC